MAPVQHDHPKLDFFIKFAFSALGPLGKARARRGLGHFAKKLQHLEEVKSFLAVKWGWTSSSREAAAGEGRLQDTGQVEPALPRPGRHRSPPCSPQPFSHLARLCPAPLHGHPGASGRRPLARGQRHIPLRPAAGGGRWGTRRPRHPPRLHAGHRAGRALHTEPGGRLSPPRREPWQRGSDGSRQNWAFLPPPPPGRHSPDSTSELVANLRAAGTRSGDDSGEKPGHRGASTGPTRRSARHAIFAGGGRGAALRGAPARRGGGRYRRPLGRAGGGGHRCPERKGAVCGGDSPPLRRRPAAGGRSGSMCRAGEAAGPGGEEGDARGSPSFRGGRWAESEWF